MSKRVQVAKSLTPAPRKTTGVPESRERASPRIQNHHPKDERIKPSSLAGFGEQSTSLLDKAEATALTQRIHTAANGLLRLLVEAHGGKAWKALGYATWEAYVKAEFDMGRAHSYRLLDHGRVIKAIEDATGKVSPIGDIPEGVARELKDDLPAATAEMATRAEQGESPAQSAKEIAAERKAAKENAKAERAEQQAQYDRERKDNAEKLPEAVKQHQVARDAAIKARRGKPEDGLSDAERIAELEESVRVLETENAELKTENALYADMKVQWQAGGYEAVIAGKDERSASSKPASMARAKSRCRGSDPPTSGRTRRSSMAGRTRRLTIWRLSATDPGKIVERIEAHGECRATPLQTP